MHFRSPVSNGSPMLSLIATFCLVSVGCSPGDTSPELSAPEAGSTDLRRLDSISFGEVSADVGAASEYWSGIEALNLAQVTLYAESLTLREGMPWEMEGLRVSHAGGTFRADHGYFDPQAQSFLADGNVQIEIATN